MRIHGEWDTALALKELTVHGGGRCYRQTTSSYYRWPGGEEIRRPHSLRGGTQDPLLVDMQVREVPGGTESAHVQSMTTGPRKQNAQQMLALHF